MTDEEISEFGKLCPSCKNEWSFTARIVCAGNWVYCEKCIKQAAVLIEESQTKSKDDLKDSQFRYSGVDWGHRK